MTLRAYEVFCLCAIFKNASKMAGPPRHRDCCDINIILISLVDSFIVKAGKGDDLLQECFEYHSICHV